MKTLFFFRGIPSSGKTNAAYELIGKENTFAADDYFYEKAAIEYPSLTPVEGYCKIFKDAQESGKIRFLLGAAHKTCKERLLNAMGIGEEHVAVANTSIHKKDVRVYQKIALENGYRFVSMVVEKYHTGDNGHGVSRGKKREMENNFSIRVNEDHRKLGKTIN
jgi:hypothetical protein